MGHSYSPIFRVTPLAGAQYTVDASAFSYLNVAQPLYEWLATQNQFIDKSVGVTPFGYRCRVEMMMTFFTPSANDTTFSEQLLTEAAEPLATIELSLDSGTTYREVTLESFEQKAVADKNIGVIYVSTWACKDLLNHKPAVGSGSW